MNKKFRCGLIVLMKNGFIKKIDQGNGGGCRDCYWNENDMSFNQVHYRLLNLFQLRGYKHITSLYDFRFRPIYYRQYASFGDYLHKHGLHANSIVIYLCAREVDNIVQSRIWMRNRRNLCSIKSSNRSIFQQQTFSRSETNSFRTSIRNNYVVRNDRSINEEQVLPSCLDYSFKTSNDKIMKDVQYLIKQNSFDEILMQILEYICIIHGYISSTIEPLIQQMQRSNEYHQSEIMLYSNSLNNVCDICQLTETLFNQTKNKFAHVHIFSTIQNSFIYFYQKLKALRNQWLENVEQNPNRSNTTTTTASSSSIHLNNVSTHLQDYHEINIENSQELSQVLPSSFQERFNARTTNKQNSIFQPVLNNLYNLLNLSNSKHLSLFQPLIELSIDKIKSIQASINLGNEPSICDGKRILLSVRDQFIEKSDELNRSQEKYCVDRRLHGSCKYILKAIKILFETLDNYQLEALENNVQDDLLQTSHDNS